MERPTSTTTFKHIQTEKLFFGALLHNKKAFVKVYNAFEPKCFTSLKIRRIYNKIVELYVENNEFVNDENIIDILDIKNNTKKLHRSIYRSCHKIGEIKHTIQYILTLREKLGALYKARQIEIFMGDTLDCLHHASRGDFKKIDAATDIIRKLYDKIQIREVTTIEVDPVRNCDKWLNHYNFKQKNPEKLIGVPTGIEPIDKHITGLRDSEFGLVIADTGVGKSIFLLDCGVHCWRKYGSVLYFTIEMPAEQLEDRFWCKNVRIPYEKFRKLTLDDKDKLKIKSKMRRFSKNENKFFIVDMPEGCTINEISSKIEAYIKKHDIKLVVIDYMNIMSSDITSKVEMDWQTQLNLAMNIKIKLARKFKLPIWSACQETGDRVAFSQHIKDNIDVGIRFEVDENTDENNVMYVSYIKARDFKGDRHTIETNRDLMTMYDVKGNRDNYERITNRGARVI